ncbi:fatty acyl-CoA reductase [Trypanosoma grayi]|uniref:fatty acyl-CoA reductase n=1 Tax=Trypanosoma grayi TaxID=71804 RepID=UPI0004F3FFE2|nr:fatty acyl-CoA reductase [Trypanosoma grayi]KEG15047.1 fatty acyl-CoA reductase [Trypanosoma grayi]
MSLDVYQAFSRKSVFLTGGSGFMGKVLIFKLLKEFPDIEAIYVLIRGKKSRRLKRYLNPQERIEKEVLGSPCFDPLRTAMGDDKFKAFASRVVIGVEGNITDDRLGLSDKDFKTIQQSVNFIVHMAATVNFDERLNVAVETNTLGSLRVLAIARECKKLEAMVHVSTCYVNYNIQGSTVEECLYPLPFDPEAMCKHILALHDAEIDTVAPSLLQKYGFPNTYTFTKSMGEQLLRACKGNCPLAIVRPSIVGCSLKEPFPGWVDALTAAGGLILTTGLGVVKEVLASPEAVSDIVPVDFVVNTIIKALFKTQYYYKSQQVEITATEGSKESHVGGKLLNALAAPEAVKKNGNGGMEGRVSRLTAAAIQQQEEQYTASPVSFFARSEPSETGVPFVYQAATSSSVNSLTWGRIRHATRYYWGSKVRHPKAIGPMSADIVPSVTEFRLRFFFLRELPLHVLRFVASLPPPIGSEERKVLVQKLSKAVFRAKDLNRQFSAFTLHEWVFAATNTKSLDEGLNERSRTAFYFDTYMINWWHYAQLYCHGMLKHIIKDTGSYAFPDQPPSPVDVFKRASSL